MTSNLTKGKLLHTLGLLGVMDIGQQVDLSVVKLIDADQVLLGAMKLVGLAQGVRDGGRMNMSIRKINVKAPYQQIPEHLDINVTDLRLGKSIKVGELSFEGLELVTPKEVVVCSIKATRNSIQAAAAAEEEPAAAAE